jgi:hypothetical protein
MKIVINFYGHHLDCLSQTDPFMEKIVCRMLYRNAATSRMDAAIAQPTWRARLSGFQVCCGMYYWLECAHSIDVFELKTPLAQSKDLFKAILPWS